jgi:MFS family permease
MTASIEKAPPAGPGLRSNKWFVVGLLWLCGFFNYADRQAVFSVFPLLGEEFHLTNVHKGMIGSAFMVVYALAAPFAGFVVDGFSRRWLVAGGLAVWSLICAATATARSFGQLLFFRAAEGLGESFYFPASMSLLADYHGPRTRSRAMSLHQTSVYVGTAAGGIVAGLLGQRYGWRSPFWVLGTVGIAYACLLPWLVREPKRGAAEIKGDDPLDPEFMTAVESPHLGRNFAEVVLNPAAALLLAVFAGANFVAGTLLAWLPQFVKDQYGLDLGEAATVAGLCFPGGNLVGALCGGALADAVARRVNGGRVLVQAAGLILGAPCVYLAGTATTLGVLVPALIGIGLGKGIYDANIFASVYDVVRPSVRGTAAGLMNTAAWAAASAAPLLVGWFSEEYGLGAAIAWTAAVYVAAGLLALAAFAVSNRLVSRRAVELTP